MRIRNIIYLIILSLELITFIVICVKKNKHKLLKLLSILVAFLLFIITGYLSVFPPYSEIKPEGNYEISYIEENYTDNTRLETYRNDGSYRELQIGCWYPKDDSKHTLVVFSHGSFGTINNNKTLCTELASRGYIVVSIAHTYQAFSTTLSSGEKVKIDSGYMNSILKEDCHKYPETSLKNYKEWMDLRCADISFIIDTVKSSTTHNVYKNVDTNKIVVMGHSMGGNAALGMPRKRSDISAVVALESAFLCDITGYSDNKFTFVSDAYPVACLNIYSDSSYSHLSEWIQYEENYKMLNSTNPKYKSIYMEGIGHMHLCDFSLQSPMLSWFLSGTDSTCSAKTNLKQINKYVLDFLQENNL